MGLELVASALVVMSAMGSLYLGVSALTVRRLVARGGLPPRVRTPVTILKPLCGEDGGLADNLRSFCRQDYPCFELVCGVSDSDDPAIPIVRRIMTEFPALDLVLVIDASRRGSNLKVANLENMLARARHPILVLSDSDMRVDPRYLAAVSAPLADPSVGLVTCLYRGLPAAPGLATQLACLHVNHGFLPQAAVADALGAGAGCFGASIALSRATLDRAGGFAALRDSLADDYALGAAVRHAGGRIVLSPHLVDNMIAEPGLAALFRHELRWALTIRKVAPWGFAGSVLTHPVILAAVAVALGALPLAAPAMLGAAFLCRCAAVRGIDRALRLPRSRLILLPLRDLLSFAVFLASFLARRVEWRDRTFGVSGRGDLTLDGDRPA